MAELPQFEGKVVRRGDKDHAVHAYQYATTSLEDGALSPAVILYAASTRDIQTALAYAASAKVSVAVRSGGHNYLGASSTSGPNLQIDLSGESWKTYSYDPAANRARCGVGLNIHELSLRMHNDGIFIPHGECRAVHLGGHIQTGGYSVLSRSFGLAADHVVEFEIVLPDGSLRTVRKESADPLDQDLWYAVLGGFPGSFGVLTQVTFSPLKNASFPEARALRVLSTYNRELFAGLAQLLLEFSADPDFDGKFDFLLTKLSGNSVGLRSFLPGMAYPTVDARMRQDHPGIYAHGDRGYFREELKMWPAAICVFLSWTGGADQQFGPTQQAVFDRVHKVIAGTRKALQLVQVDLSESERLPVSLIHKKNEVNVVREYPFPFVKQTWSSPAANLDATNLASLLADHLDRVSWFDGIKTVCQLQLYGGDKSAFRNSDAKRRMAYSWRDSTVLLGFGVFYKNFFPWTVLRAEANARNWLLELRQKLIGQSGVFAPVQRRFIWGPFLDTPAEREMKNAWHYYYESIEIYERLLEIKNRIDPQGLLASTQFRLR